MMKHLQWPRWSVRTRRSMLAGAAATSVGFILSGSTAQTTETATGEKPRPIVRVAAAGPAGTTTSPRPTIDFPHRTTATTESANLFAEHSWYVPPPPPPPQEPEPPPPPTAPPLPFTFMGSYDQAGGGSVFYLVKGDQVYDVKVGDTLDGVYSVDAVRDDELVLTYLPLKQEQQLALAR